MNRLTSSGQAEVIRAALDLMPDGIRARVEGAHVFAADPIFAGLHGHKRPGMSYRNTAHVLYPGHLTARPAADRLTTIVLPPAVFDGAYPDPVKTAVHEYGHVLDWVGGFEHTARPVTQYGTTNRFEAFAEAFAAWIIGPRWRFDRRHRSACSPHDLLVRDRATVAYFQASA